jgi:hypothetical protein
MKRRIFWIFANTLVLAAIVGAAWAILLPAIRGPDPKQQSDLGGNRARR